jgi:two-component system sensor kinase FixL
MFPELGEMLPVLFDVLGYVGVGVTVIADRGNGFERWYVNSPAAAVLGYSAEELLAAPAIEAIAPAQRAIMTQFSASLRAGQPVPPALEFTAVHKDGTLVPIELAIGHFRIVGGLVYVMVMRDVSAYHSQLSLLEADRIGLVAALSAGFAHEINNPLTSMVLNLRAIRRELLVSLPQAAQPQAMRRLDDITSGAERIATNVHTFQTLATRGPIVAIDLAAVVARALRLAAPTLDPRARVIQQIFPVRRVQGEESRIGQAVFAILLFSASGFEAELSNRTNQIIVSVEQRDADVVLEVSDNGRDLTPEETQHAFDPFYRSLTRGADGGRLGIVRRVASTLGGEVTLAARTGGGAVITMRLPAAD